MKGRLARFLMRSPWSVDVQALHPYEQSIFQTIDTLQKSAMTPITLDARSGVARLDLNASFYVKTFKGEGSRIKFLLNASRYQRELHNLSYFKASGLQTPQLIAHGHQAPFGILRQAVLVTAEVKEATDLEQLVKSGDLYRNGIHGARKVLHSLAIAARQLHADGFYHKDFKPRNILVRLNQGEPELFFFDCPSGHHPPRFLLRRGIVRDLANLEEGLRGDVRRVDMLFMYKIYRGCNRLDDADKALAKAALSYQSQRRMTRKRRLREARRISTLGD